MKFGPVPVEQAVGSILAHHIPRADGGARFRKGKPLTEADVEELRRQGRLTVYVAGLEPGDVGEDRAAARVAQAVCGPNLLASRPNVGRVNLQAAVQAVLRVDAERLLRLNEIEGVTVATRPAFSVLQPRQTAATIKIIPFAVPEKLLAQAEALAAEAGPLMEARPMPPRRVALVLSGAPQARERTLATFVPPVRARVEALGSRLEREVYVPILEEGLGEEDLERAVRAALAEGAGLVVLAGETAVMDRRDMAPRAVERLGGQVELYGAPVDPGSLLMLAYLGETPVLGAPGCARSPRANVLDWVLPRLLSGERLSRRDVLLLGHGGLLEGLQEGASWRERLPQE